MEKKQLVCFQLYYIRYVWSVWSAIPSSLVAACRGSFAVFAENIYLGSRVRPVESEPDTRRFIFEFQLG